jgi:hypothetical protein
MKRESGWTGIIPCQSNQILYEVVTMLYEEQNTFKRTPGLVMWLFWVASTIFGGIVGTFPLSFVSNANPSLNWLLIWFYLASPLFFVALGQWLLLRRFVAQSGWWLLTGVLGFIFVHPYLLIYSFSALLTNGQSLIFGTQEFWKASFSLAIMSLIFGSLVGLLQGFLVIRRWEAAPRQLLWWVIGSALSWGVGYPLGEQFLGSLFWHSSTQFPQAAMWLVVGTTWGIIGAITGAVLVWVGRACVKVR